MSYNKVCFIITLIIIITVEERINQSFLHKLLFNKIKKQFKYKTVCMRL